MTPSVTRVLRAAAALICAMTVAVLPADVAHADRIRDDQWHLRFLNVVEAHQISQGAGVIVAVIDTGVDPHPDLLSNLLPGTNVFAGETGDDCQDQDGHGTAMAGLIAAHGQGDKNGALGIAPKAKILPICYKGTNGSGDSGIFALGIEAAVRSGAGVISLSSGGGPSPRLSKAVEEALAADVVVVAAAGNKPIDFGLTFPAFLKGIVAVGATDIRGNHSAISVTGQQLVITAPGVGIYSTSKDGRYYKGTGTSNSTAIVAGAAALVRSKYPNLSATEVVHRLTATATDKGKPGRDEEYGYGVLNLVAALTADGPPLESSAAPTATVSVAPSATSAKALPEPAGSDDAGRTLLIAVAALAGVGLVSALLGRRSRRRRAT